MNKLRELQVEIQSHCYWFSQGWPHGSCMIQNHMDHMCVFCTLVEKMDVLFKEELDERLQARGEAPAESK